MPKALLVAANIMNYLQTSTYITQKKQKKKYFSIAISKNICNFAPKLKIHSRSP